MLIIVKFRLSLHLKSKTHALTARTIYHTPMQITFEVLMQLHMHAALSYFKTKSIANVINLL